MGKLRSNKKEYSYFDYSKVKTGTGSRIIQSISDYYLNKRERKLHYIKAN